MAASRLLSLVLCACVGLLGTLCLAHERKAILQDVH